MKKLLFASTALFLCASIAPQVFAESPKHEDAHQEGHDDHHHDHEEEHDDHAVEHYEGKEFKDTAEALQSLKDDNTKIMKLLTQEKLSGDDLEAIHQISYGLEDAIDLLIKEKFTDKNTLEATDEAIQAVHYASENHEEAKVRDWQAKLVTAIENIEKGDTAKESAQAHSGVYELHIKDHKFTPEEIRVPAGQKIKLVIHNDDPTPEEFESDDFRREKIIAGNSKATIHVGPLKPGKYHFFGEFNLDTANGYLYAE
ncbi:MAG: DUF6746 family protein [Alphaproteobacteria bacterium]